MHLFRGEKKDSTLTIGIGYLKKKNRSSSRPLEVVFFSKVRRTFWTQAADKVVRSRGDREICLLTTVTPRKWTVNLCFYILWFSPSLAFFLSSGQQVYYSSNDFPMQNTQHGVFYHLLSTFTASLLLQKIPLYLDPLQFSNLSLVSSAPIPYLHTSHLPHWAPPFSSVCLGACHTPKESVQMHYLSSFCNTGL